MLLLLASQYVFQRQKLYDCAGITGESVPAETVYIYNFQFYSMLESTTNPFNEVENDRLVHIFNYLTVASIRHGLDEISSLLPQVVVVGRQVTTKKLSLLYNNMVVWMYFRVMENLQRLK